jgi:hypothetical protein
MATTTEVLEFLIPEGGWAHTGEGFDGIQFLECKPITKQQFEAGFAQFDAWKVEDDKVKADTKAALLNRLGITADEAKLLLA